MVPRREQGARGGGADGNENEDGDKHAGRDGSKNGSGDKNSQEGGGEAQPGNVPSCNSGNRGGPEDARGGATQTSKQQLQPQDPTSQQNRRIMRRARAEGREAREGIGEGKGEAKKRKKLKKSYRRDVRNGRNLGGRTKKRRQESIESVHVDQEDLENRKKAGRKAQGAQSLRKNCRESLSRLIRSFRNKYH